MGYAGIILLTLLLSFGPWWLTGDYKFKKHPKPDPEITDFSSPSAVKPNKEEKAAKTAEEKEVPATNKKEPEKVLAEKKPETGFHPCWVNLILGMPSLDNKAGTLSGSKGSAIGGSFNFDTGKGLFAIRALSLKDSINVRSGTYNDYYEDGNEANEIGLLYGFVKQENNFLFAGGVGISSVNGKYVDHDSVLHYTETEWWLTQGWVTVNKEKKVYDRTTFSTIGVPLELQLTYTGLRYFGVGVYAFGNVNSKVPYYGAGVNIQFGRFY
ncbi:MAG: hypothetical protein PHD29_05595 [bacterium]|nr:hypothetical protein [bacterium]MDD5353618.1 hypothetical protein [bacterium]MDD5756498.1 hypothetical protein [bacterium]